MSGRLALVGSGEFLPAMSVVDTILLEGAPARVAVIPTAAAPEGDRSVRRWFDLAHRHYDALGAEVVEVDVRTAEDADGDQSVEALEGCGLIYLSGGNPAFLAETLRGTALAAAIAQQWAAGAALAGCSAGAMALGSQTLSMRGGTVEGLGLAGAITTIPHFDKFGFAQRLAGLAAQLVSSGVAVVGVDEETAVVWEPGTGEWRSHGAGRVYLLSGTGAKGEGFPDGVAVPLPAPV
ncbi:Type 1 glutamine amidotransferase-like domain-containing protein [Euzebya tangerina]|uniref:Type 1 glutamine amidotransferase-like domain-containing protein n=1 Tax=Euzebya tangerina TaxID=591198 RepID=UPI0013C33110|nr:Type 1 glutamine amidotransferase-like domain-containing protein [Euzebya tangerina]